MASTLGYISLMAAFVACGLSAVLCFAGCKSKSRATKKAGATLSWVVFGALTISCLVLVVCFLIGDTSIFYVVSEMPKYSGPGAWFFKVAGLWGGGAGSLLFWAWLISLFNVIVALKVSRGEENLDALALGLAQVVLMAFLGVVLFSGDQPFAPVPAAYLDADGNLSEYAAQVLGMNMLLQHWAMAIHPPTLFVGYAGFTIPFVYAIASLILGDCSDTWVRRSTSYAMVSWFFLSIGIGLGAVWAYVVLGWGGYWGWDPVENASLLPWLIGVALIHSFTVVRQRGAFKRWAPFCACLTFSFVVLGTFITRSGIVQSVHAFEGDVVSLLLFLGLIVVSLLAGIIGVAYRWKSLGAKDVEADTIDSFASKDAAYYMNNLVLLIFSVILAYFTLSSALPTWMPFGGSAITTGTYEAIARPLGILYCALIAICPLLSWRKTDKKAFAKRALIPGICALVLFGLLLVLFFTKLYPAYEATIAAGGTNAADLLTYGPSWYYHTLAIIGLLVASLLFFNALFVLIRALKVKAGDIRARLSLIGGSLTHAAMGIILIGLVGSAMYTTKQTYYLPYDEVNDTVSQVAELEEYKLTYTGSSSTTDPVANTLIFTVNFDVEKAGKDAGSLSPTYTMSMITGQTKLDVGVQNYLFEDLFVVFNGFFTSTISGEMSMILEIRINPLISFVWVGFGLLLVGMGLALGARRSKQESTPGKEQE